MIRVVLGYEKWLWLRGLIDRLVREQLADLEPGAHRRAGCNAPLHERTAGCRHCRFRAAARRRRYRRLAAELRLPNEVCARGGVERWRRAVQLRQKVPLWPTGADASRQFFSRRQSPPGDSA
jgi:hypothetical protein